MVGGKWLAEWLWLPGIPLTAINNYLMWLTLELDSCLLREDPVLQIAQYEMDRKLACQKK